MEGFGHVDYLEAYQNMRQ